MKSYSVERIAHSVKDLSLCILSAILLILSFPNFDFWIFAWVGFVPLFLALQNTSRLKAFFLSYFTGIIFWSGIIYWLIHVTLPGTLLLILYLALYFGIFGLILTTYNLQLKAYSFLFIPSVWGLLEYVRSRLFTGFPWALLGYSQYLNLPIIQIADITGAWGVSFLVMMINVTIYKVIGDRLWVIGKRKKLAAPITLLFFSLSYGYYKLYLPPAACRLPPAMKASVIQGNIPQELKWDPQAQNYIIEKYFALSRSATGDNPDLIIWPEAAVPVALEEGSDFYDKLKSLAQELKVSLVLGAVTSKDDIYHNSALLFSREGNILNRYDKLHLVPFGEYIPLKKALPFLETVVPIGDITAGKKYTIFRLQTPSSKLQADFSVLICFEDLFPELSRQFVKRGADFLVNITNDAWYKRTAASSQHLQASVFRAVENRVSLARAANTGISGFISSNGKIVSLVEDEKGKEIFVDGFKTQRLIISKNRASFYNRYADFFPAACFLFVLYGIIRLIFNRPK
jgi:apolipoprotein N-acyltransferase